MAECAKKTYMLLGEDAPEIGLKAGDIAKINAATLPYVWKACKTGDRAEVEAFKAELAAKEKMKAAKLAEKNKQENGGK